MNDNNKFRVMKEYIWVGVFVLCMVITLVFIGTSVWLISTAETDNGFEDKEMMDKVRETYDSIPDHRLGESVDLGGVTVTLNKVRYEKGSRFDVPKGDIYLVTNLTIENHRRETIDLGRTLRIRAVGSEYEYPSTLILGGLSEIMDGELPQGDKKTVEVPFDVLYEDEFSIIISEYGVENSQKWAVSSENKGENQ